MEKNKECLEKILCHLTKLICLTEFDDVKSLSKLVDMAACISAQLTAINGISEYEVEE